jgi:PKD repeat protein
MIVNTARTKAILVAVLLLLTVVPTVLLQTGDAVECEPKCDDCHYAHDRVYYAYLDITRFRTPTALNGTDVGEVEVQLYLHGNVGLGYTSIRRGHLTLTANNDRVGVERPKQDFISMQPGFRSFKWNVSGRLEGSDSMHVEVYALGVHLNVEFFESGDSGTIVVTNPVNAPPRVTFTQPDGNNDVATNNYQVVLDIDDPNNDPMLADFYYDNDRDRSNGSTIIARSVAFPDTYTWDTRGIPNGWYYIHVDMDDQMGGFDSETSVHPVIVSHGNGVPNTELVMPLQSGVVRDPEMTLTWRSEDLDGDKLSYEVWIGRDLEHMELVGTTEGTSLKYEPDDNARLFWTVIPNDGTVRGWCRNGPRVFTTAIDYPVEVDLLLPPDGSVVPGPDVKLVWYGRDLDFEQVLYTVWLEHDGVPERLVNAWDDPAGPVLIVPDLVPGETYTWWVEGDNPYSPRGESDRWSFTVAADGVPVAHLVDEEVAADGVTLYWAPSGQGPNIDRYDLHLVDHVGGDTLLIEGTGDTAFILHDLVEDAMYSWYVIPYDDQGDQGHSVPTFRTFTYDTNAPPTVLIANPYLEMAPGPHVLEWSGHDDDGDDITYDIYMDPVNATELLVGDTTVNRLNVVLEADRMYFWRVVPRDAMSIGVEARGVVITGPAGTEVGATGRLLTPTEGAMVPPPLVNLTWEANDTLDRTLLYTIYVNTTGGDPLEGPPLVVNASIPWFIIELSQGTQVTWAVEVRPLHGPVSLLGTATFDVAEAATEGPVASLSVDGLPAGERAVVEALVPITFDGRASTPILSEGMEFLFDFGDGTASGWVTTPTVEHTYLKEGAYNATLTVRLVDGPASEPATARVKVSPGDPTSDEEVPGAGGALGALAMMLAALIVLTIPPRWHRRGGGT